MNSLMLQKFLLTCAFFRLLNEATDTRKNQPATHILSIKMKEGGGRIRGQRAAPASRKEVSISTYISFPRI